MDWGILILIVVFAIGGLFRGIVRQALGLVGVVVGLWVAVQISRWVGAHWQSARPAVVFWALRWLVAALAALVVASLFHWWAVTLRKAVQAGPAGWLDRALGVLLGAVIGVLWATALIALAVQAPGRLGLADEMARARTAPALLTVGARACDAVERHVPGFHGLGRWLHEAERRNRTHTWTS